MENDLTRPALMRIKIETIISSSSDGFISRMHSTGLIYEPLKAMYLIRIKFRNVELVRGAKIKHQSITSMNSNEATEIYELIKIDKCDFIVNYHSHKFDAVKVFSH